VARPGSCPALGANSLRLHDRALAAAGALTPRLRWLPTLSTPLMAYVFGAVARHLTRELAQRRFGLAEDQWRASVGPYVREVIAGGAYPSSPAASSTAPTSPSTSASTSDFPASSTVATRLPAG
jgi:hypothetical protein